MVVGHNRSEPRGLSLVDRLLSGADEALRTSFGVRAETRANPAANATDEPLARSERLQAGRLMRVNHAGEVAAQALYHGQALTARDDRVRMTMANSAAEESDHLAWCQDRLDELGARRSLLGPLWYAGSFAMGALAGLAGDRWSLGFVAETENQVMQHLDDHIDRLPTRDARSRTILETMRTEEAAHGQRASDAGGARLPQPVRSLMTAVSRVMTRTAYWV